jgi:hypothetical protein
MESSFDGFYRMINQSLTQVKDCSILEQPVSLTSANGFYMCTACRSVFVRGGGGMWAALKFTGFR